MINKQDFKALLEFLGFKEQENFYIKSFEHGSNLKVDFKKERLIYPEKLKIHEKQTCNFSSNENIVVFECVYQLLDKGYKPEHIELEPKWKVGHGASGGRADILVRDQKNSPLLIIECKTYGREFDKAWRDTLNDGGQLFSYAQQISKVKFLCLYASEFKDGKLLREQRIISLQDNDKILQTNKNLKSYKEASNAKERFEVWKDTYQLEFTEKGVFESNIQPYQIGKTNYTLEIDTRPIQEGDKKGKYHRFRTILRQHNIARRETAFEVLVNLFLAKIVDEKHNRDDLKFYWKGIAYDNYFDFVDRLQNLYRTGMGEFLKEEVAYISNEQIDKAFWTVKGEKNATKETVQEYFRQLKFFSNNAFSLINVHNKELFNKNTEVLVELVQMWQGLRLKTKEPNQFLGDMFEYFLDNSIKQSEGQFFTPLPITKFIISSLPLEDKIKTSSKPIKAIDYACGSGHFLVEYAHQIRPIVKKFKSVDVKSYYENTIGIEKEDRLAKIAKVSSFMYGQDGVKIFDKDALISIDEVKDESFDILVANPPFAVEGFLLNLTEEEKRRYELIKTVELNSNTNNIQCFFIERAKQLIKPNGVIGIIVPSSILSNSDMTHIATREIILKYFDIVSIVELGSGTFGKTGTNTVVLFLKRKDKKPELSTHYFNRVEEYFRGDGEKYQEIYQDMELAQAYSKHINIPFEEYKKLFGATADKIEELEELFKYDIFVDYKKDFENSTHIKNLKKKKNFKEKSKEEQKKELDKLYIEYLYKIEKEKLYYFILAYTSNQKILIVKTPTNNKAQKQFLGYEWSGAKGQEGIKYNGGTTVNDIITPLFNPKDRGDKSKINYLIQQNFLGKEVDLKGFEEYQELIRYIDTVDILDFSRKDFNKSFALTPKKEIKTKWELIEIEKTLDKIIGNTTKISKKEILKNGKTPVITQEENSLISGYSNTDKPITDLPLIVFGDHSCTFKYIDFEFVRGADGTQLLKPNSKVNKKYFYYIMQLIDIPNKDRYERHLKYLKNIKIPLPPKEIQQKIVDECEIVDSEVQKAEESIKRAREEINKLITDEQFEYKKLSEVVIKVSEIINPKEEIGIVNYIGLENIESNTSQLVGDIKVNFSEIKSNKSVFRKDDILYGKLRPNLNKVYKADFDGICSTDILVFRPINKSLSTYYKYYFLSKKFNQEVLKTVTGQQLPRTSWDKMSSFKVPIPPLSKQKALIDEVEILENQIKKAKTIIEGAKERKEKVMERYL